MATPINFSGAKPIVLNGVGSAFLKTIQNGLPVSIKLGTLQDMTLEFTGSVEKVYGGDSRIPIYVIDKDSDATVTFTEASFDLDWLGVVAGANMSNNGVLIFNVDPTLIASGTAFTVPGNLTTINPSSVIATLSDDANGNINVTSLAYTSSATPTAGQFTITAAGVVTLGTSVTNKYLSLNGLYTDTVSRSASITTASLPGYVEIRHVSKPIDMGDGIKNIIHTYIPKAKSDGKLTVNQARQKADTPKMAFGVFYDTTRTDGLIVQMTQKSE